MSSARQGGVNSVILISGGAGNPISTAGVDDPTTGGGVAADEGSIFHRFATNAGEAYLKTGSGDTDWTIISTTAGGSSTLYWTANDAIFPGTAPAAATSRNQHALIAFDDTTDEAILLEAVTPPGYVGVPLSLNIHWVAATAVVGDVRWGASFERDNAGGHDIDSDSFAAQQVVDETTAGTAGIVSVTTIPFTQAQADSIAKGDAFRIEIERVASNVADDMVGDAQILRVALVETEV